MAPRKKQAAATPPAHPEAGDPEQAQPSSTYFLDLGDDIYGRIYACLEESDDRKALRHSCGTIWRSPAVNAHIDDVMFEVEEDETEEDVIQFLAAFPSHATLKSVHLCRGEVKSIALCALASAPMSVATRERCRNVNIVILEDCKINDGGAAAALLTLIFFKMRDPFGEATLRLKRCSLGLDFLDVLSTQSHLKALQLVDCEFVWGSVDGLMPLLGAFSSLSSLTLHMLGPGHVLDCLHLEQLQSLQELVLKNACLAGFDTLLPRLSSLRDLELTDAYLPHLGCHLASSTVETIWFGSLQLFPEVSMQSFPALQAVNYSVLDLSGLDGLDDAQKVHEAQRMASWLSKCPVVNDDDNGDDDEGGGGGGGGRYLRNYKRESKKSKYTDLRVFELKGKPGWSGSLCDALLQALAPLKEHYEGVRRMRVVGWKFTELSSLSALYGFLDSVACLRFVSCTFGDGALRGGFVEAVQQLPSLEMLWAEVQHPPRDMLAALAVAQLAGRKVSLSLVSKRPSCGARLREACEEWVILSKGLILSKGSGKQAQDAAIDFSVEGQGV